MSTHYIHHPLTAHIGTAQFLPVGDSQCCCCCCCRWQWRLDRPTNGSPSPLHAWSHDEIGEQGHVTSCPRIISNIYKYKYIINNKTIITMLTDICHAQWHALILFDHKKLWRSSYMNQYYWHHCVFLDNFISAVSECIMSKTFCLMMCDVSRREVSTNFRGTV